MTEETLNNFEVVVTAPNIEGETVVLPEYEKLPARVKSVKKKLTKTGERASFCFELKGEYAGKLAWGSVPLKKHINENTNLFKWVNNIVGETLPIGTALKLGNLEGKDVLIIIKNSDKKKDDGTYYQNVVEVLKDTAASTDVKKASKPRAEVIERSVEEVLDTKEVEANIEQGAEDDVIEEDDLQF